LTFATDIGIPVEPDPPSVSGTGIGG